jgi:hypothetical protein
MKRIYAVLVVTILVIGFTAHVGSLSGSYNDVEVIPDQSLDEVRHFALQDGVPAGEEYSGYTETPTHQPLDIQVSDDSRFQYMACSPYYKVYFRGARVRVVVQDAWIECELINQELGDLGEIEQANHVMSKNTLSDSDVFMSVDLSYVVGTSLLHGICTSKHILMCDYVRNYLVPLMGNIYESTIIEYVMNCKRKGEKMNPVIKDLYTQEEIQDRINKYLERYEEFKSKNDYSSIISEYNNIAIFFEISGNKEKSEYYI